MNGQVWAVSMMRDEADVARAVLDHLADEGVDGIIVADNRSTDGTRDILEDARSSLACQLVVIDDPEVGYFQARKITALAALAAEQGAQWIVPFDADEVWYSRGDRLASDLRRMPDGTDVVSAGMLNHFCTALDLDDPCPFRSMTYRRSEPNPMGKVAFRWSDNAEVHQGNHLVTFGGRLIARQVHGSGPPLPGRDQHLPNLVEIRHFPYRSASHMVRKARNGAEAYRATDLPADVGAHWRQYGELIDRLGEGAMADVFREHFWFLSPTDSGLVLDPAPFRRFAG